MSDAVDTPDNETTTTSDEAPQNTSETPKDELPKWARDKITSANQDAANRRVQLRAAEQTIESLQEQVASLTSERDDLAGSATTVQTDFDKLVTAVQTLLPEKQSQVFTFAKTLQGSTGEELANHAAELNQMFGISASPSPAVDRSQGLGSGAPASDPGSEFARLLQTQLSR